MLSIQVDASGPIKKTMEMMEKLKEFPEEMASELTDWQTQDMRRVKETNTALKGKTAETIITQHTTAGRLKQHTRTFRRKIREQRAALAIKMARGIVKPILRPMLLDKLCTRMQILLFEKLKWQ